MTWLFSDENDEPHAPRLSNRNKQAEQQVWATTASPSKPVIAKFSKIAKKFIVSKNWYDHDYKVKLQPHFHVQIDLFSKQVWQIKFLKQNTQQ